MKNVCICTSSFTIINYQLVQYNACHVSYKVATSPQVYMYTLYIHCEELNTGIEMTAELPTHLLNTKPLNRPSLQLL